MAGDILIIEGVATNRIVLKVKLLAAQYRVRPCSSLAEAALEIEKALPDLILVDLGYGAADVHAFCQTMKADSHTELVPIIVTGGFATPKDRVSALRAGADDILVKPFDDHLLQARIRSALRARDASAELKLREDTRTALGFEEASSSFATPSQLTVVQTDLNGPDLCQQIVEHLPNTQTTSVHLDHLFNETHNKGADIYVLDFRAGISEDSALFRLLAELRSQSHSRHSALLAILPDQTARESALALDLGANDVVCAKVDTVEIAMRCKTLLRKKHDADALRITFETSLEAAITDPLTGLFNRRYALPHLSRLTEQGRRAGNQTAVMVLDLDHFKTVNDTYGHAAGDEILKQVARRLQDNLRAVDLLARIGGEEFLVALPNSDQVHARMIAERLCKLVSDAPFYIEGCDHKISMTMSVGVSISTVCAPSERDLNPNTLMSEADTALYAAKTGGRNKVSLSAA